MRSSRRMLRGLAASFVAVGVLASACQRHAQSPTPPTAPPILLADGQGLTPYIATTRASARRSSELALRTRADSAIAPVPLDLDQNGPKHGALYTPYLLAALAVRDARAHGRPVESRPLGSGVADIRPVFVVAAYPLECGRISSPPVGLRLVQSFTSSAPPRRLATALQAPTSDARLIDVMLPGERLPPRSLVGSFRTPFGDLSVEVDYGAPSCPSTPTTLIFPITRPPGSGPGPVPIVVKLPEEYSDLPSPTTVQVMGLYDATGRAAFPGLASGPVELAELAENAARDALGKPDQLNGLFLPSGMMRSVIFTATGEPPPPARPPTRSPEDAAAFQASSRDHRATLALAIAKRGPVTPIPLDKPGLPSHGFAYDNNMLAQLTVRTLLAGNPGITPAELPTNLAPGGMLIVALPLDCGPRRVVPTGLSASIGERVGTPSRQMSGRQLRAEFPEVDVPDDALAAFLNAVPIERAVVAITYAEPACPLGSTIVTLTAESTPARPKNGPIELRFPDGIDDIPSPTFVQVDGEVDAAGRFQQPMALRPPRPELGLAAEQAALAAEWQPRTINGVAVSTTTSTSVRFWDRGESISISPNAMEGSTSNARGLSRDTSRCAISDDPFYGTRAQAIPVGGDDWRGVAYERAYLSALRGPNGQGVTYRIIGAEFVAATRTFLDVFELTYDGIAAPARLYLDEYRSAPLSAPPGFTCAAKLPR